MAQIKLKVLNKGGVVLNEMEGENEVNLVHSSEYQEGDRIVLEVDEVNTYYHIQFDDAKGKSFVYLTGNVDYEISFVKREEKLSPKMFAGNKHVLSVKKAFTEERMNYRNLAENLWDQDGDVNCYPHASSNVYTPVRTLFAPQCAIDGLTLTEQHGRWPYSSWSIGRKEDATWKVEFGRFIEMDKIVIYTRADYPHDSWWIKMTVTFSDGSKEVLELNRGGHAQIFDIHKKNIEWLEISELIKADDPSPFPALTQLQVYGRG